MDSLSFFKMRAGGKRWARKRQALRRIRQMWMIENCGFITNNPRLFRLVGIEGETLRSFCRRAGEHFGVSWRTCYDDWRDIWFRLELERQKREHLRIRLEYECRSVESKEIR